MQKFCFTISFISCLYMFRAHVLIIRRSKLHYTASGIITPIGRISFWILLVQNKSDYSPVHLLLACKVPSPVSSRFIYIGPENACCFFPTEPFLRIPKHPTKVHPRIKHNSFFFQLLITFLNTFIIFS